MKMDHPWLITTQEVGQMTEITAEMILNRTMQTFWQGTDSREDWNILALLDELKARVNKEIVLRTLKRAESNGVEW